ncbi:MAG TPA: helix-turn-helix domain-containing protein [Pseudonocardia sp.]|uniref:PucR family transcriptional regulator n=1 Tax=Pseudonocardia sp. TaxID=60912 RepID=UPI002D1314C7|nr:helix-turn-helix domain-containing protein [Pseudonocardia sp.]HTF55414.1 helix-turn-helix domain-containing protein [Pseudonocardia sp.]
MTAVRASAGELEVVSRHMLCAISQDVAEYAGLGDLVKRDLVLTNIDTARLFLQVVDRRQMPTDSELDVLVSAARQRAHQGIPLAALLRAYRVGAHAMWTRLSGALTDLDHQLLTDSTLRYIDCASSAAEVAYLAEREAMLNSLAEATRSTLCRLLEDDFDSPRARRCALRALGLNPACPHVAAVIAATTSVADPEAVDRELIGVLREVRHSMPSAACAQLRQGLVLLVPAGHTEGVSSLLRAALRRGSSNANLLSVGISRPSSGDDARTTIREAERARAMGEILFPDRVIHEYDGLGMFDLFRRNEAVDEFVETILAEYARHDRNARGELVRTLHAYFTLGMNRRATATRLGIHPNTLDYRLRKAAQVGGIDVNNAEQSFRFQLAVRLLPICSRKSWLAGRSTEQHSDAG